VISEKKTKKEKSMKNLRVIDKHDSGKETGIKPVYQVTQNDYLRKTTGAWSTL